MVGHMWSVEHIKRSQSFPQQHFKVQGLAIPVIVPNTTHPEVSQSRHWCVGSEWGGAGGSRSWQVTSREREAAREHGYVADAVRLTCKIGKVLDQ
ncbi:hypothetical protein E2C01_005029 [Portunus trituberculatus]|uniref:Uncharacterized protein n=1 Tax=Portunus trituberculatus TaxID=210409 RepID=A0A5B7CTX7_PORTR|nr:hypothetical protein [Portunus trituberculatus]